MGMTIPPIAAMTIDLLWIWPRPGGASFLAQVGPYLLSLLTGLPFALRLCRGAGRIAGVVAYLVAGFVLLWLYAVAVLCGVRDVCL
jgi:Kef-type K+ transport system membrane component KefB